MLVNYIREAQIDRGVPPAQAYQITMYILAGFLVVGFFCNLAVRPVAERRFELDAAAARPKAQTGPAAAPEVPANQWLAVAVAWLLVTAPLAWGVYNTMALAGRLFTA